MNLASKVGIGGIRKPAGIFSLQTTFVNTLNKLLPSAGIFPI